MPAMNIRSSIDILASPAEVTRTLSDFRTWPHWSPWLYIEPEAKLDYQGTVGTPGHSYSWAGKVVGAGQMTLSALDEQGMRCALEFQKPFKSKADVGFKVQELATASTRVSWSMKSSLPFFMFFMTRRMNAMVERDYERGLRMLKDLLETGSVRSTCKIQGETEHRDRTYIGIRRESDMANIAQSMQEAFGNAQRIVNQEGLAVSSSPLAIYHKMDHVRNRCTYTAALPIATPPESAPDGASVGTLRGGRCFCLTHCGPYRHLPNAWSRAYAELRARKLKPAADPWEEYLNDPAQTLEDELLTCVCIPLR